MPVVTFIEPDGTRHQLELTAGQSVMEAAVGHALNGMTGECSGSLACGTCHCFVDTGWIDRVGTPSAIESDLLDCSPVERTANSRLGCQITLTEAMDGLVIQLPESQY